MAGPESYIEWAGLATGLPGWSALRSRLSQDPCTRSPDISDSDHDRLLVLLRSIELVRLLPGMLPGWVRFYDHRGDAGLRREASA